MNDKEYKNWISSLPLLTAQQLDNLSTRIKLLDKSSTKTHVGKQEFGLRVLQAICDTMNKDRVETPTVGTLRRSQAYVAAKLKMQDLQTFFELLSPSKIIQDVALKIAVGLLYDNLLTWKGVAVSSHLLLKQIHRLPSVLNQAFPGHANSGLLAKIIKGQQ